MIIKEEEKLIQLCKSLIEAEVDWGSSTEWTTQDFKELSQKIFDKTSITLSPTTLKRIWGKLKYESAPTLTTLNTLAQFLGFSHWRAFRQAQLNGLAEEKKTAEVEAVRIKGNLKLLRFILLVVGALFMIGLFTWNFVSQSRVIVASDYSFGSKTQIVTGVPKSVVFEYNTAKSPIDSIFIQPSEAAPQKQVLKKGKGKYTSIYYEPGYYKAKLLIGKKVVQEQELLIKTRGWLATIEQNPPIYLSKEEFFNSGNLTSSLRSSKNQSPDSYPSIPFVRYSNVKSFGNLTSDDFVFETAIKNAYLPGTSFCKRSEIRILCAGANIQIPIATKACIDDQQLVFLQDSISGKTQGLSGFGVDFEQFASIRCEANKDMVKFFVNNALVCQLKNPQKNLKILGIVYRFQGGGAVDYVRLSKGNGKMVYREEDFQ